jgi:hypothetical protein
LYVYKKRFLVEEFGVRLQRPYPILLAKIGMLLLEANALCPFTTFIGKFNIGDETVSHIGQ